MDADMIDLLFRLDMAESAMVGLAEQASGDRLLEMAEEATEADKRVKTLIDKQHNFHLRKQ